MIIGNGDILYYIKASFQNVKYMNMYITPLTIMDVDMYVVYRYTNHLSKS